MSDKSPFFPQLTEIAAMKATLLRQPGELHGARLVVADAERDAAKARRRVKDLEAAIADERAEVDILVISDPGLKNAAARKAKTAELIKDNATIARLKVELTTAQDALLEADIAVTRAELGVKHLEDQQRAWRAHVDATQAEVQLLVAGR